MCMKGSLKAAVDCQALSSALMQAQDTQRFQSKENPENNHKLCREKKLETLRSLADRDRRKESY